MEFELTDFEKDIVKAASEFANKEFPPISKDCDDEERFPKDVWRKACSLGFVGSFIKSEYGGNDLNTLQYCLILREFWKVDPGCGNLLLTTLGAEIIEKYGGIEQKGRYLPGLPKGESIIGVAIFEDNGNLEIVPRKTISEVRGGCYVVSGGKTFVINGTLSDFILILCRDSIRDDSYNVLIVNTSEKGFKADKLRNKLGIRATDIAKVDLNGVEVQTEDRLGEDGNGLEISKHFLDVAKIYECAQGLGLADGAMNRSISYSKKRYQFNRPIKSFQAIQQKIADMYIRLNAAESLFYRSCYYFDRGTDYKNWITITNVFAREVISYILYETVQIHGGYGYVKEEDIERFYRDSQFIRLFNEQTTIERAKLGEFLTA